MQSNEKGKPSNEMYHVNWISEKSFWQNWTYVNDFKKEKLLAKIMVIYKHFLLRLETRMADFQDCIERPSE